MGKVHMKGEYYWIFMSAFLDFGQSKVISGNGKV